MSDSSSLSVKDVLGLKKGKCHVIGDKFHEVAFPDTSGDLNNIQIFVDIATHTPSTTKSTGVLVSGKKGNGKTLTLFKIAKKLGYPTIQFSEYHKDIGMIASFATQPLVFIFDEVDKWTFEQQQSLLPYLSGFGAQPHFFLFSGNKVQDLPEYMISRMGRIRYHKRFRNLNPTEVSDLLGSHKAKEDVLKLVRYMGGISVDNYIELLLEIDKQDKPLFDFIDYINLELENSDFRLVAYHEGVRIVTTVDYHPMKISSFDFKVKNADSKYEWDKYKYVTVDRKRLHIIPSEGSFMFSSKDGMSTYEFTYFDEDLSGDFSDLK